MAENKYEAGARQIVEDLKDTKWKPTLSSGGDQSPVASRSPLVVGLLAFALFAIWRLRR